MATLRFGVPALDDAEQVILGTRWGDAPTRSAADAFFPFAVAVTSTGLTATMRNITGGGTEAVDVLSADGLHKLLHHPESGLLANGITDIALFNVGTTANTITTNWPGRTRIIAGLENELDDWFALAVVPDDNYATLDALVTPAVATYADNPDVYGYILDDDVTAFAGQDDPQDILSEQAMLRVQALDAANRPGSPSLLGWNLEPPTVDPPDVIVLGSGTYASRWTSVGVKRADGDFTIDSVTWPEWADVIRDHVEAFPDARVWWWCQAHKLGDGSGGSDLSYPTATEIRKMTWEAIGSGAKGLIWFIYQDLADNWDGLAHPNSRARLQAIAEMNARIDQGMRTRLLRCAPYADQFAASGGESADWAHEDYANAFVGTLHDAVSGIFYCVVCNRNTSTENVTITSATFEGDLINLETGVTIEVGGSVSLPALDGAIFRFIPGENYGVPHHMPDAGDTTEEWWDAHWANPDGSVHVAYEAIDTHPNVIDVDPADDLQAVIDAAPDNTTFRLAAGDHGKVRLNQRSGIHIIAADPLDRPTMNALYIRGRPAGIDSYTEFVDAVVNDLDPDAIAAYIDPPRDFLVQNIDFEPVEGELAGLDDTAECINLTAVANVCIEGCTFGAYRWVDNTGGAVGPIKSGAHGGYVSGTGGIHNVVIRNCEATPVTYEGQAFRAWSVFVYFDGAAGCAIVDNEIIGTTGFNVDFCLFLTNDDFAPIGSDDYDGVVGFDEINGEIPHARYNAVYRNLCGPSAFRVDYGGRNLMHAENSGSFGGTIARVVVIDAREPSHSPGLVGYAQLNSVVRDNSYTGGGVNAKFVDHNFDSGEFAGGSTVGLSTITGNTITGSCAAWYGTTGTGTAETPNTATNNTDSGGARDGV